MAEPPGILCQGRRPVNINDGTMCAAQSPKPGITGDRSLMDNALDSLSWAGSEIWAGTEWVGAELWAGTKWTGGELWAGTKWAGNQIWSGAEWTGVEIAAGAKWSLGEIRGGAVWVGNKVYDAYKYVRALFNKILHAANWDILKAIAEPILGPYFQQAGILWGVIESLGKDIVSLLELGKMLVLAGCYELMLHPQVATALALNPTTMPMVLTALALQAVAHQIPDVALLMKNADVQLKKMLTDLWSIVSSWDGFVSFMKGIGHQIKQETVNDFTKLKSYAQNRSLANDFEAGRILGRALYQVLMLVLIVVGAIGAVRAAAGFLGRVPALLRAARILKSGGEAEELIETERVVQETKAAQEVAEAEKVPKKPSEAPAKQPKSEPTRPKPVAADLATTEINGVKPVAVLQGTNDKVAVIGRNMTYVKQYQSGLSDLGYETEIFDGKTIPRAASEDWERLTANGRRLTDEEILNSKMYQANLEWAQKLTDQGYTVVDVGNPAGAGQSVFYNMERSTIFGGAQ